ncbi:aminoglycoside phosphotransferase family protein [bacterium]|nr:aminoglycoside phosphotransferase family protein [bacterium]
MNTNWTRQADEDAMRQCLEDIVSDICGTQSEIASIHRRRSDYSSWYSSDIITVQLVTGVELMIFLKDFGSYPRPKEGMVKRRERELCVYRNLLAEPNLGTPKFYGSVWDEPKGRFWLLLEFVNGIPVKHCNFEYWIAAAGWLGQMQGYFAKKSSSLRACSFLKLHDAHFFQSTVERALQALSQISKPLADRMEKMVNGYDRLVTVMASQPLTLVHGAYLPSQIIVDIDAGTPRICPVDWELAAVGSALYDFAFLADGFDPQRRDRLWEAYRQAAAKYSIPVPEMDEVMYIVDCFRLHKIINWLSQALDRQYPEKEVAKLVHIGERLSNLVL